ncbi:MAG: hypothetical protein GEEBNDBF_00425 [bacterium]|nr:hypothetical protein [bacterium]
MNSIKLLLCTIIGMALFCGCLEKEGRQYASTASSIPVATSDLANTSSSVPNVGAQESPALDVTDSPVNNSHPAPVAGVEAATSVEAAAKPDSWVPELPKMARAVNGDVASEQSLRFNGIWMEMMDSIETFTAEHGHRPSSLTELFDALPLFYHPVRQDQSDWPIIDRATGGTIPAGAYALLLDHETLHIQFTVGEPGTVSKSFRKNINNIFSGVPSMQTELATFAIVERIKDFGRRYGRLPESHAEMLQALHLRPHRMQPQPDLLASSQFGIEVWINTEHNLIRVSERDQSGWSPERLFTITFDPAVGSLRSKGEILKPGDPRLSTEGYQLFLVSQVN